jgi:hypothetical protein
MLASSPEVFLLAIRCRNWSRNGVAIGVAMTFLVVSLNFRDEVLSVEFHKIRGSQRTQVP